MSRQVVSISLADDGQINIDWIDTAEMTPQGGEYHSTFVTLGGQEADEQVEYWAKEIRQDLDEFLHHVLKMLKR